MAVKELYSIWTKSVLTKALSSLGDKDFRKSWSKAKLVTRLQEWEEKEVLEATTKANIVVLAEEMGVSTTGTKKTLIERLLSSDSNPEVVEEVFDQSNEQVEQVASDDEDEEEETLSDIPCVISPIDSEELQLVDANIVRKIESYQNQFQSLSDSLKALREECEQFLEEIEIPFNILNLQGLVSSSTIRTSSVVGEVEMRKNMALIQLLEPRLRGITFYLGSEYDDGGGYYSTLDSFEFNDGLTTEAFSDYIYDIFDADLDVGSFEFAENTVGIDQHPLLGLYSGYTSPNPKQWRKLWTLITSLDASFREQGFLLLETLMLEDRSLLEATADLASFSIHRTFVPVMDHSFISCIYGRALLEPFLHLICLANEKVGRTNLFFPFETNELYGFEQPLFASSIEKLAFDIELADRSHLNSMSYDVRQVQNALLDVIDIINVDLGLPSVVRHLKMSDLQRLVPHTWDELWTMYENDGTANIVKSFILDWMFNDAAIFTINPALANRTELAPPYHAVEGSFLWHMPKLQSLDMSEMHLDVGEEWDPQYFNHLPNLKKLSISGLGVVKIPQLIVDKSLKELDIGYNSLQDFPRELKQMRSLKRLVITQCMDDNLGPWDIDSFAEELRKALPTCEIVTGAVG